ncbi:uncharacterized protein AMSG_11719 [Thecamonas trahens ATCC 50062]|uniref:Uncharacterized protein n=1 Tax=Thecamonas trahens ATCC 50062 TaxID=461836 RepID=A0A0L0D5F4_THETB|nr:hypothetical protein AMSG_11719 [Thecamonas trahens ATCC 50062]KNC47592.1 hypothetical protein AMSG_11719 [Thecamonas trahens ATCC 50062]|eukprot:XP_013759563.1 hypothetical protein AMSG_11719 [Thecamonas trahens ATCC 50062]
MKSKRHNIRSMVRGGSRRPPASYMQHYHQVEATAPLQMRKVAKSKTSAKSVALSSMPPPAPTAAPADSAASMVELPVKDYLALLEKQQQVIRQEPPHAFVVNALEMEGQAGEEAVTFVMHLEVEVLTEMGKWTTVPLLPTTMTLLSATFERNGDRVPGAPGVTAPNGGDGDDDIVYEDGIVGVSGSRFVLFTCVPGVYSVHMEMLVPFTSQRKNSTMVSGLPRATRNMLTFMHPEAGLNVTIQPSLRTTIESSVASTTVRTAFPASTTLNIQWTPSETGVASTPMSSVLSSALGGVRSEGSESDSEPTVPSDSLFVAPEVREERRAVVTVDQNHLLTVTEGVLFCSSSFEYTILHNGVSTFHIDIPSQVRVLAVSGSVAVRKWEVVPAAELEPETDDDADGRGGKAEADDDSNKFVLIVSLRYPKESTFTLRFESEVEMKRRSQVVNVPSFHCRGVVREKGYIGVTVRSNVELSQQHLAGRAITKIDSRESPPAVQSMAASQPILLAYKFLATQYDLQIGVTKHADVAVLVAIIENAEVLITVTEEGKLLYETVCTVRNNSRQYLRMELPDSAEVWTTAVRSAPVKPAEDAQQRLIVPIPKSNDAFMVKVTFLVPDEPIADRGTVRVPLPKFDLPAMVLRATIYVPQLDTLSYQEPDGDMLHVPSYTFHAGSSTYQPSYTPLEDMVMQGPTSNVMYWDSQVRHDSNVAFGGGGGGGGGASAAGIIPMDVTAPKVGTAMRFERLVYLTEEPVLTVAVPYRPAPTGLSKLFGCC